MKKLLVTAGIAIFSITGVMAQASFGLKAGVNVSNLRTDVHDNFKSLIGANGGFFAKIPLSTNFVMQPEVLYSLEGAKLKSPDATYKLNYVNVPVMFKYQTTSGLFLEAGPQIGFLTSAKYEIGNTETDFKNQLKSTNVSVGAGIGYNLDRSTGVGVRYNLGVSNINENSGDLKTSNFSLGLHYNFGQK